MHPYRDICAFFSFRARLKPCLLTDETANGGGYLIDQLALRSAAAQPVLLTKVGPNKALTPIHDI